MDAVLRKYVCIHALPFRRLHLHTDARTRSHVHYSQGEDGKWNKYGGKMDWDQSAICSGNEAFGGRGNPKQGDDYGAAPNIDHSQVLVNVIHWHNLAA